MAKKVRMDAGHGGTDPGACGNGLEEANLTLDICKRVQKYLEAYVVDVSMTRTTDKTVSLKQRTDSANKDKVDLFVSIHINAGGGTGFESFRYVKLKSSKPQKDIHEECAKVATKYKLRDRGQKAADLHVCRETAMDAVLTEVAFIDTKSDATLLKNKDFIQDMAVAHAKGIIKTLSLKKKVSESKPEVPSKPVTKPDSKDDCVCEGNQVFHIIKGNDTFWSISQKYKTTVAAIEKLNPGVDATKLKDGQKVRIK